MEEGFVVPELASFGKCWSCDAAIGWLTVNGRQVTVNAEPSRYGSVVMLMDGRRGLDLTRDDLPPIDRTGGMQAILYVRHNLVCDGRGLKTMPSLLAHQGRRNAYTDLREARREVKLRADRLRDRRTVGRTASKATERL